jgi:nucleoside 2-deoxyribosyltransferase
MKIALCGSTDFYPKMTEIKQKLVERGHTVFHPRDTLPPDVDVAFDEGAKNDMSANRRKQKNLLIKAHMNAIKDSDAVLIVNLEKKGIANYIGGNTFLEMGFALAYGKKIYILNELPTTGPLDEITGMLPVVLKGRLETI